MLSRSPAPALPPVDPLATSRPDWDVFCKVIDNLGDIGVCWRLARQMTGEHALRVRLWVDNLTSFHLLCPEVNPALSIQHRQGIEVRRWDGDFPRVDPARVVLETFACRIPESFVEAMAKQSPPPVWLNLDYLSAEDWVAGWHALPSPYPQLPLIKYFFFPGFRHDTGGLLREGELRTRRQNFLASADRQLALWNDVGFPPPTGDALLVSLFAYENPAIGDLLSAWEASETPVCCVAPLSSTLPAMAAYAGQALTAGQSLRRGALELRILPFLQQDRYDQLLWLCRLNFVRGEDSFVRAQWAARPLVWQAYPQEDATHLRKLDAFLTLYGASLPNTTGAVLRDFWQAWNKGSLAVTHWRDLAASLDSLDEHAHRWDAGLAEQDDLCTRLIRFSRSKL